MTRRLRRRQLDDGAAHADGPAAPALDELVLVASRRLPEAAGLADEGEDVGLRAGTVAVAGDGDVRHVVPHADTRRAQQIGERPQPLAALVHPHRLAEVEAAIVGEELGQRLPATEVDGVAVGGQQLADGEPILRGELTHAALIYRTGRRLPRRTSGLKTQGEPA